MGARSTTPSFPCAFYPSPCRPSFGCGASSCWRVMYGEPERPVWLAGTAFLDPSLSCLGVVRDLSEVANKGFLFFGKRVFGNKGFRQQGFSVFLNFIGVRLGEPVFLCLPLSVAGRLLPVRKKNQLRRKEFSVDFPRRRRRALRVWKPRFQSPFLFFSSARVPHGVCAIPATQNGLSAH